MDIQKYEKFEILSKQELSSIKGEFLEIKKTLYKLKNNENIIREELIKNNNNSNAVIILPLTKEKEVILVIQPRTVKDNSISIEFPAGYVDKNESYIQAAKRELLEETGYGCENLIYLCSYYQDQGCSKAKNACFLALDCIKIKDQELDKDEYVEIVLEKYSNVLKMIDEEVINDGGSIIAFEKSKRYIK